MAGPLACAVLGMRRLGPVSGDPVVVIGADAMGLLLLAGGGSCCCPGQGRRAAGGRPASWALRRPSPTPARSTGHAWRSRSMPRGCRRRSRPRRAARPWRAGGGLRCAASPGRDQHLAVPGLYRHNRHHRADGYLAQLRPGRTAGIEPQPLLRRAGLDGYQPERSAFHHVLVTLSWSPITFRHRSRYPARYGGDIDAGRLGSEPRSVLIAPQPGGGLGRGPGRDLVAFGERPDRLDARAAGHRPGPPPRS